MKNALQNSQQFGQHPRNGASNLYRPNSAKTTTIIRPVTAIYKLRGGIERYFGKLKENKRLCLRFDKEDRAFLSFVALAAIKIFFNLKIS